jgi:hypothetical protein
VDQQVPDEEIQGGLFGHPVVLQQELLDGVQIADRDPLTLDMDVRIQLQQEREQFLRR